MKKIVIIMAVIIMGLCGSKFNKSDEVIIPKDSIRFRIIASSNDEIDINLKMKLKAYVEEILYDLVKNSNSYEETNKILEDNLDYLDNKIYEFLGNHNYTLDYGINYFPRKVFKGVIYDEGFYNSVVISLGNGKGNNWWCVLFPPLCLLEENTTTTDVEYKLYISRIIDSFK